MPPVFRVPGAELQHERPVADFLPGEPQVAVLAGLRLLHDRERPALDVRVEPLRGGDPERPLAGEHVRGFGLGLDLFAPGNAAHRQERDEGVGVVLEQLDDDRLIGRRGDGRDKDGSDENGSNHRGTRSGHLPRRVLRISDGPSGGQPPVTRRYTAFPLATGQLSGHDTLAYLKPPLPRSPVLKGPYTCSAFSGPRNGFAPARPGATRFGPGG